MASTPNRYIQIIEQIFSQYYKEGATEVPFAREDFSNVARKLKIKLPKNLGDILYSFLSKRTTKLPFHLKNIIASLRPTR